MATGNQFNVNIGTILDTSNVPQQLQNLNSQLSKSESTKIKLRLDTGQLVTAIKEVNQFNSAVGKIKQVRIYDPQSGAQFKNDLVKINEGLQIVSTETNKWTNSLGQLVTQIKTTDNAGNELITETTKYVNALQQEVEEVRLLDSNLNQLGNTTTKVSGITQEMTTSTSSSFGQITDTINGVTNTYRGLITTTEKVGSNGEYLRTVVSEYTNELGQAVVKTEQFDKTGKQIATTERQISNETKKLGMSFSDAFDRLSQFYLASLPIRAVQNIITSAIETVKEFDSALIEFKKVSDLAGESLTEYVAKLAEMGEITGSTMQAMVEASTEFRKSGFSDEDSAKLASIAEKYRNIADEEISAGESASFIIAQMKAFNIEADQAEHIIDAVNEVANNFSVSSADLATNLGNMSAIMAINNVSMEQQIGMLTGVTEITRNASSASRGLVMVSSRLTQVLDDTSSTGKKLTKIYNDLGIELKNEDGQLRSHYDILGDLAEKWNTLSENEQKYIALTSAGARQQQNFVALMENWNQVANATITAYDSMGSAQRENEKVMDSVEKKVEILKSQFQQLVIGDGGLQSFAKIILDIGITLLEFVNSDLGQFITISTLATVAIFAFNKALTNIKTSIISTAKSLATYILQQQGVSASTIASTVAQIGFANALKIVTARLLEMAVAFLATPLGVATATIAGIVGLITVVDAFSVSLEESTEKLHELKDSATQNENELENLKNKLQEVTKQIDELNGKKLGIVGENQLSELKLQSTELERQIKLKEIQIEQERKLAEEEAKRNLKKGERSQISDSGDEREVNSVTQSEEIVLAIKRYKQLTNTLEQLKRKQLEVAEAKGTDSYAYKRLSKSIENTTAELEKVKTRGTEVASNLVFVASNLTSTDSETVKLKSDTLNLADAWTKLMIKMGEIPNPNKMKGLTAAIEEELRELSEGGNVDLTIRPVIDADELNKQAYDAGEGAATVFSSTFSNEAGTIAANFTPILTDPTTGEYLGVFSKPQFEKYCEDVIAGGEDYLHLQIGAEFEGEDAIEQAEQAAERIHELHEQVINAADGFQTYEEAVEACGEASEEADDILKQFAKDLGIEENQLVINAKNMHLSIDNYYNYAKAIKSAKDSINATSTTIDGFQDALSKAQTALNEYNEKGYLTIDTFQDLINVSSEYLTSLINEDGQIEINQQSLANLVEQLKSNKIEELQLAEVSDILAYAFGDVDSMSGLAKKSITNAGTASKDAGDKAQDGSKGFWSLAEAISAANAAAQGDVLDASHVEANIQRIHNAYANLANSLKNTYVNTTKVGNAASTAGKKGASAAKQAKDATKDLNQELEKLKSQYEKVISYLSSEYDRKISELEKAKEKELKILDEEIDALEKEKDAEIEKVDEEIDKLKEEEKTFEETTKERIETLKDREKRIIKLIESEIKKIKEAKDEFKKNIEERIKIIQKEEKAYKKAMDAKIDALEKEKKAFKKQMDDEIDAFEKNKKAVLNGIDDKIKALKEEKSEAIKSIEAQSKALKKEKEERQKYWEERIDALKKENDERKDAIELQEKLDALEAAKNTKVKVYKEGEGFVYDVDQTQVQKAQKELDEYLSEKAYEEELERLNNLKDAEMQSYSDRLNALDEYKEQVSEYYEQQITDFENYREKEEEELNKQLEQLKDYRDRRVEEYDEELEKLKTQKEERVAQYEEDIEKLKEYEEQRLEEYEKQIDHLEELEEKTKEKYDKKIEDLEKYLDEKKEKYEKEIDDLEKRKDELEKNYDDEIDKLKEHRDAVEEQFDAEIEKYKEYKEEFEDMVSAYEREQDKLLAAQLTGIGLENDNWMTRLDQLQTFVNAYNALLAQLNTNVPSTPTTPETPSTPTTPTTPTTPEPETPKTPTSPIPYEPPYKTHASGVSSIGSNELAVVGENPNKEIVLGSKLNNGELMSLSKGTGVVNAESTNTLAGMLNQVGKFGASGFGSGNGTLNNNINNDSLVVNGVTIQGSNISDPQTFVNGLLNLKAEALQRAYRHS